MNLSTTHGRGSPIESLSPASHGGSHAIVANVGIRMAILEAVVNGRMQLVWCPYVRTCQGIVATRRGSYGARPAARFRRRQEAPPLRSGWITGFRQPLNLPTRPQRHCSIITLVVGPTGLENSLVLPSASVAVEVMLVLMKAAPLLKAKTPLPSATARPS